MGISKSQYNQILQMMMQQIQQQNQLANTPSPYENQLNAQQTGLTNFINKGDYRNTLPGYGIDMAPIAQTQKLRQMTMGGVNTGQGQLNPQLLSTQRDLGNAQYAGDYQNAFQNRMGNISNQRNALLGQLQNQYNTRIGQNQQTIGDLGGYLQALNNRPKGFWSSLLPGLVQGGLGAATMFL